MEVRQISSPMNAKTLLQWHWESAVDGKVNSGLADSGVDLKGVTWAIRGNA
jgi:hypothetical protein